jgi:peptide/nickel transport system permease protein
MSASPVTRARFDVRLRGKPLHATGHPLVRVVVRRLLLAVPLLFVVTALSFVLVSLTPGNAAQQILGDSSTPAQYQALRRQLGLDQPLYEQYWHWLTHALSGDFGTSVYTDQSVTHLINQRVSVTLSLILLSLLVVAVLGIGLGALSAVRGGAVARLVDALSLAGFALPVFWVAAVLVSLFAVRLHLFPVVGYVPLGQSPTEWLRSLALPVIALSLHSVAALAKQTREALLDALGSEYVRMARANGISSASILFQHSLKNAAIRIVTIIGLLIVGLLGGTVIVETIFALPGLGSLAVTATTEHDIPLILGIVVYYTVIVIVVNLLVDVAYTLLNPRVRTN